MWFSHMTFPTQLNDEVLLIEHLSIISQFFELRDVARDQARDFFRSCWAYLLST